MNNHLPFITPSGVKSWYQNGKLHREDGPAIETPNGNKYWYQNDQLHREDGPAVEWTTGRKEWWINGKQYSFQEWLTKCSLTNEEKIELALCYG